VREGATGKSRKNQDKKDPRSVTSKAESEAEKSALRKSKVWCGGVSGVTSSECNLRDVEAEEDADVY